MNIEQAKLIGTFGSNVVETIEDYSTGRGDTVALRYEYHSDFIEDCGLVLEDLAAREDYESIMLIASLLKTAVQRSAGRGVVVY